MFKKHAWRKNHRDMLIKRTDGSSRSRGRPMGNQRDSVSWSLWAGQPVVGICANALDSLARSQLPGYGQTAGNQQ